MWFMMILTAIVAYLLGNANGAILASHIIAHEDVRDHGSGNAGLTNFIRNYGAGRSLLVILIDAGKAVVACLVGGMILGPHGYWQEGLMLGGVAVMLGHDFPALLGFRGGKGILSGLFVAISVDWRIAVVLLAVFAIAYFLTNFVSLGSVLAAIAFGVCCLIWHSDNAFVMWSGLFISALTVFMHKSNIARLVKGQERKTNLFKKGKAQ